MRDVLRGKARIRQAAPITLPNGSEPEPDIAIVEELGDEYLTHHPYPKNIYWVIEYSHTSLDKDLGVKAEIYAEVGILEYWVIHLQAGQVIVFRQPVNGNYRSQQVITQGTITPLAFPQLAIPITALLR